MAEHSLVTLDAKDRAYRTFLVALGVDVALALALFLFNAFDSASHWGDLEWSVLSFLFIKTIVTSAASYVLRLKLTPKV